MYKTTGLIIKKTNLGEYDRLLTVYTREQGKILVRAKSVRKNQAKLRGHLELFLYAHLMLAPARGFDIITGAETIEGFAHLHQNLSALLGAHYLSEVLDNLIPAPQKDQDIFSLVLNSFEKLNQQEEKIEPIISNFEKKLLEFLGYGRIKDNHLDFMQGLINKKLQTPSLLTKVINCGKLH